MTASSPPGNDPIPPIKNILLTMPRTASHLLTRLLNLPAQPSIHRLSDNQDGYLFMPALMPRFRYHLSEKPLSTWTDEETTGLKNGFQKGFDALVGLMEEATEQKKGVYFKEHVNWLVDPAIQYPEEASDRSSFEVSWPGKTEHQDTVKGSENVTCLPDAFLLQHTKPTILVRHPALAFPSNLRTAINGEGPEQALKSEKTNAWECTYRWSLSMYKFYAHHPDFDRKTSIEGVQYPIVLDAQDLGDQELVRKYARAVGLDEKKLRFEWEAATEQEVKGLPGVEKRMKKSILGSKGVEKAKLSIDNYDLGKLRDEWTNEFGDVLSERLVRLVNESMGSYEELRKNRLTP